MDPITLNRAILSSEEYRTGKWLHCLRRFLPEIDRYRDQFRQPRLSDEMEGLRATYRKLYLEQTAPTGEVEIDVDYDSYTGAEYIEEDEPVKTHKSRLVMTRKLWAEINNVTEKYDPVFLLDWAQIRIVHRTYAWATLAKWRQRQHRVAPIEYRPAYENWPDIGSATTTRNEKGQKIRHVIPAREKVGAMYRMAQQGNDAAWLAEEEQDVEIREAAQAIALYGIQDSELPVYLQPEVGQADYDDLEYLESVTNTIASELRNQIDNAVYIDANWEPRFTHRRIEASPETIYQMLRRACGYITEEAVERKRQLQSSEWKARKAAEAASEKSDTRAVRQALHTIKVIKREMGKVWRKMSFYRNLDAMMEYFTSVMPDRVINLEDWYDLYAEDIVEQGYNAQKIIAEITEESRHLLDHIEAQMFSDLPEVHVNPTQTRLFNQTFFYLLMDERKDVKFALKEATRIYCQKYPYVGMKIENGVARFRDRFGELKHSATVRREIISGKIQITSHQRETLRAIQDKLTAFERNEWSKVLAV